MNTTIKEGKDNEKYTRNNLLVEHSENRMLKAYKNAA
jgi:hypothetical protein